MRPLVLGGTPIARQRVSNRLVLYVSGFDPRGAMQFGRTLATQSARWGALTDVDVMLSRRPSPMRFVRTWHIEALHIDGPVSTDMAYLAWDDIIRANWERHTLKAYVLGLASFARMTAKGVVARAYAKDPGFAVTLALPAAIAIACLTLTIISFAGICSLLTWLPGAAKLAAFAVVVLASACGWWIAGNLHRTNAAWIARIETFTERDAAQQVAGLAERRQQLADTALAMMDAGTYDEVLLIGFSLGTPLAASLAARMIRARPQLAAKGSPFRLVTLGQTIPLLADFPEAQWFRDDLSVLAAQPALKWFDFSSRPDGACYATTNPLSFIAGAKTIATPHLLSAQFYKSVAPERMAAARHERMLMHFLYLESPDFPDIQSDGYDFYSIVLGPMDMKDRFARRTKTPRSNMPAGAE